MTNLYLKTVLCLILSKPTKLFSRCTTQYAHSFVTCLLSLCAASASGVAQYGTTVGKWEVHELTLKAHQTYENPYREVQVKATFEGPEGNNINTTGYWDGGNRYKVRFTPTQEGQWTYRVMSNQQEDRGLQKQGILEVTKATDRQHGFVRRDAEHPYHFVYDDGTRYYMWGTTYYNMVLNALQGDRWKTAIDSAMAYGINKIRIFANSTKSDKTPYPRQHPFLTIGKDSVLYDQLNISYWQALDSIVHYAYQRGMIVDLMPFGYGAEVYSTVPQEEHYLRYVVSRYAAYPNVIWCLVNEWNYISRDYGKDKPYWNQMGRLVRDEDPWMSNGEYLRPLSIHQQTRVDFQFFNYDWPVHAIVQYGVRNGQGTVPDEWDNTDPKNQPNTPHGDVWGNLSITYNLGHDMPVVNDEYGYIGEPADKSAATSDNKEGWPAFTRKKHRQVSWGIALAGGYGSTGDKNQYEDGHPYFSANWHSDPPEYEDVKHLIHFFTRQDIAYWRMHSNNKLVSSERVYALEEPGKQYLFYAATGGKFAATIQQGNYQTHLYNPRTGAYKPFGSSPGGSTTFVMPDTSDWVLYVKASPEIQTSKQ